MTSIIIYAFIFNNIYVNGEEDSSYYYLLDEYY